MEQKIVIKRNQYYTENEEENISKLKMDFRSTHFGTYDTFRDYLHIQVGEYDDFNLYLEMSPREAEELFLKLAENARKLWTGY